MTRAMFDSGATTDTHGDSTRNVSTATLDDIEITVPSTLALGNLTSAQKLTGGTAGVGVINTCVVCTLAVIARLAVGR